VFTIRGVDRCASAGGGWDAPSAKCTGRVPGTCLAVLMPTTKLHGMHSCPKIQTHVDANGQGNMSSEMSYH